MDLISRAANKKFGSSILVVVRAVDAHPSVCRLITFHGDTGELLDGRLATIHPNEIPAMYRESVSS